MTIKDDKTAREILTAPPKDDAQMPLFKEQETPPDWASAWKGMPEFRMGNTEPFQKITVSFASLDDVKKFAELIGQNITSRTDSIWYPNRANYIAPKNFRYVDES